jgi:hypothetical protein
LERIRFTWVLSLALADDEVLGDLGAGESVGGQVEDLACRSADCRLISHFAG